jgi:RES domain-containing protein
VSLIDELIHNFEQTQGCLVNQTVYRVHSLKWAFAPLSGDGAKLRGGRFNPKGQTALYTCSDQFTAMYESKAAGDGVTLINPVVLLSYIVTCDRVLDAFDHPDTYAYFSGGWLLPNSKRLGWKLFERARQANVNAIIVPSYTKSEGKNVIFINWSADTIKVHDPDGTLSRTYGDRFDQLDSK